MKKFNFKIDKLNNIVNYFEKFVIIILVSLMGLLVLFTTIELTVFVIKELFLTLKEPQFLLDKQELIKIFALFFNVLIGLELFETVKLYLKENMFHAEFVLLVTLIAILRKIIIIEYESINDSTIYAIAALVFVLTLGYYLLKQGQLKDKLVKEKEKMKNEE